MVVSDGTNLLFVQIFIENCMKIKEFWPRGAHVLGVPLRFTTEKFEIVSLSLS